MQRTDRDLLIADSGLFRSCADADDDLFAADGAELRGSDGNAGHDVFAAATASRLCSADLCLATTADVRVAA